MGTSTSNPGQKGNTPLVPSWLDDVDGDGLLPSDPPAEPSPPQGQQPDQDSDSPQDPNQPGGRPETQEPDPRRFSTPRSNFTRFINSGGSGSGGRNLRRAISSYVTHSSGGSHNATVRLGSARRSTARLLSVVGGFASSGIQATAQKHNLGDIIGKPAQEAFLQIMDFVCPDGGQTDDGIARSAYVEALATIPDLETKQIEDLSSIEFLAFMEIFMTNVIVVKIENDIGNNIISLPDSISQVNNLQEQLVDLIRGCVSDAFAKLGVDIAHIDTTQTQDIVDSVYKIAFDLTVGWED